MTFLPIVERELRVAARRHSTFSMRLLIASAAILVGVLLYCANLNSPTQVLGQRIFQGLSILALVYGLVSGRRATADCLSEEKREGTLGLLFLTDLKGYDIVLGKLAATSLNGFFALLALFPVLAVPLLMGGITNGEFWRMVLVLVNTFLLSLAIGVMASALSWDARRAMGANFLLLLLIMAVLPACAGAIAYLSPSGFVIWPLLLPCPVYAFNLSSDTQYKWEAAHFWSSMGVMHILTWMLVAWASRIVPRSWQDQPADAARILWRERWQVWTYGSSTKRAALRRRLLRMNAFYWLAARAWFKPAGVWLALGFVACWWLFMLVVIKFNWSEESFCLTTGFILNCLLKLWIAVEAGQRLAEDQKLGALELLLTTPLTVRDILRGQLLALRRQFLGPLLFVVTIELVLVSAAAQRSNQTGSGVLIFGLGGLLLLLTDLGALIGVGIATALTARSPNRASVSTVFRILILPTLAVLAVGVMVFLSNVTLATPGPGWEFYVGLWFWLGVAADLAYGLPAWWRLRTQFRQLAAERLGPLRPVGQN